MTLNSDFYMVILLIFMPLPLLFHLLRLFWCVFVCVCCFASFSLYSLLFPILIVFLSSVITFHLLYKHILWHDPIYHSFEAKAGETRKKTICLKIMNFKKFTHFTVIYCSINSAYIRQWRYSSVIILKQLFKCASMFNGCNLHFIFFKKKLQQHPM